jgi:hypothetical protein
MTKYNIQLPCILGIQVEAQNHKEAREMGIEQLYDMLEDLNENFLGQNGYWLTENGGDELVVTKVDDYDIPQDE